MDPKTIAAAKAIPREFKDLMDALFDESKGALRQGVGSLRKSLGRLEDYLQQVEEQHLGSGQARKTTKKRAPRRRRSKRFPIAEFVLSQLQKNSKGMRPKMVLPRFRRHIV